MAKTEKSNKFQQGQSLVEYALIIGVVSLTISTVFMYMGNSFKLLVNSISSRIQQTNTVAQQN